METVNKVVDAGYKAIWGEHNTDTTNTQATASGSQPTTSTGMTGIQSVDKIVDASKKAIWGETTESQQQTSHGEEPVAGKMGLGTATDPYDAGNRDEQYDAPPVEAGGLPASIPVSEQRNIDTTDTSLKAANMGSSSDTATAGTATAQDMKMTVIGLRPDPAQPGNAADSTARAIPDGGPGQTLKHTSEPFEEETQKLAKDLQDIKMDDDKPKVHTQAGGVAVSRPNQTVHSKEDDISSSSSSSESSAGAIDSQGERQKSKTSKLEKMKNKLHIGSHSPKASR